jgi:hypothetical protein
MHPFPNNQWLYTSIGEAGKIIKSIKTLVVTMKSLITF